MRITVALICAAAAAVFALLFDFWIRKNRGTGRDVARIFAVVKGRVNNFRSFQYVPVIVYIVVVSVAAGIGINWECAAACLAGAVLSILPVITAASTFTNGITASYNEASDGEVRKSVRSGYRAGAVYGIFITAICLIVFCVLLKLMKTGVLLRYSAFFALGACIASMVVHTGGEVYSSSYSLAVPARDFTDRSGSYIGSGSDTAGSYILALASAMLLAEVGVATSGVSSTFTTGDALRYPVVIYAAGVVGSVAGVFLHRAGLGNDFSRGSGIGVITAGLFSAAAAVYFSNTMLQSYVYGWAVLAGILGAVVLFFVSRLFSSDSKILINGYKTDRNLGRHASVIFNLGTGMIATAVYTIVLIAAIAVSYMFASFYGVGLCAAGMTSILGSVMAVSGMVNVSSTVSEIIENESTVDNSEAGMSVSGLLDTVAARNLVCYKSYSAISGSLVTFAAFCALFYISDIQTIDLLTLRVFGGIIAGVSAAFLLSGLLINSVRITGRVALRDIGKNDDDTGATSAVRGSIVPSIFAIALPTLIGLFLGVKSLAGFNIAAAVTGYMIIVCTNYAGMHYEKTAILSLSSLLKLMVAFSVAFLPVFMKVGGFLLQ